MPQVIPSRAYYVAYLYLAVHLKHLQNQLLGIYMLLHKRQVLEELGKLSQRNIRFHLEKTQEIVEYNKGPI